MKSAYDTFMNIIGKGTLGLKRAELITSAYVHVLENGSGTGVNFKYYNFNRVDHMCRLILFLIKSRLS